MIQRRVRMADLPPERALLGRYPAWGESAPAKRPGTRGSSRSQGMDYRLLDAPAAVGAHRETNTSYCRNGSNFFGSDRRSLLTISVFRYPSSASRQNSILRLLWNISRLSSDTSMM